MAVIARNIAFLAGAILAVLVLLTIYDEDVITVEHVLSIITILGAVVAGISTTLSLHIQTGCLISNELSVCRSLIPEENLVWCPESLMEAILAQVHYLPVSWKGQAHTAKVTFLNFISSFKSLITLFQIIVNCIIIKLD